MMNLVGELVLTRNQVLQATSADPNMTLLSRRLDMVTADLRESVMKARMQPVSNIFSKIPRIVRDLSQALGRRVRLQVEGQDTELDKSLLEAIKDPLTHAVRNSLDHGIEPPDVRLAAGKDPEGTLKLRAAQEGSHVIIEVSDDGAGIAVEKIRQKAIERGLITAERAKHLADRELLQLIFLPGFSTAAAVTNVSGRGVGMDVVRTNVERIGGKVEIDSRAGKGTTLRLRIPLTLAIIPALIVRSVNQSFALPQGALSELVHIPPEQAAAAIEWIEDAPLYRLRGKLLPLIFLDRLLMPGVEHKIATERDNFIAVLDADGRRFGLVVDGLADPEEIVVKPLSAVLKDIGLFSGATVLGNADLALILDPGSIALKSGVSLSEEEAVHAAEDETDAAKSLEYLLVEVAGRKAAVPLADVLRIEQLPLSRIEYIGYRPVLNFDGQLLPVEDSGGLLAAVQSNSEAPDTSEEHIIVVVCREGNRHVGIAVSHVLDVAAGGDLFEAGTTQRTDGVTLLKNHVTGVVDLGGVPPLPAGEAAQPEMEPDRGDDRMSAATVALHRKEKAAAHLVEMCSVRLGQSLFGVPITHILEIVGSARPQPVPLAPVFVGGLFHYRGDVLTTVSLRQLLGMPPKEGAQDILVLESSGGCFGLLVDSVGEVLTVSSADHEPNPVDPRRAQESAVCRRVQAEGQPAGHAGPRATGPHAAERPPGRLGSTVQSGLCWR